MKMTKEEHGSLSDTKNPAGLSRAAFDDNDPGMPQTLRGSLLLSLGRGAAAGFLIGLLYLAAAEGLTGYPFTFRQSAVILFLFAGWIGISVYCHRLMHCLLNDR